MKSVLKDRKAAGWARLGGLLVGALLVAGLPATALAVDRDEAMLKARAYAEHRWPMGEANQKGACTGEYASDQPVGERTGVPYAWGGFMSLDTFDQKISDGYGAGSHSWHGVLSCVAGVDCSGYVSQVWGTSQKYSTSGLGGITTAIEIDDLKPADAFNKAGSHVVLFAGYTEGGEPVIYEASGGASRVRMATPGWGYLAGYIPVRYNKIQEVAPPVEPTPPPTTAAPTAPPASEPKAAAPVAVADPAPPAAPEAAPVVKPGINPPSEGSARVTLTYGEDVGFASGGEDSAAVGPDFLAANGSGLAVVYDPIRRQAVLIERSGGVRAIDVGTADGLDLRRKELVVMDAMRQSVRLYDLESGLFKKEIAIPQGRRGATRRLENGVLWELSHEGDWEVAAELVGGEFKPPKQKKTREDLPRRKQGEDWSVTIDGQTLELKDAEAVSARRLGPFVELEVVASDAEGRLMVARTLRNRRQAVELPTAVTGPYAPMSDLSPAGNRGVVFLHPKAKGVDVVWVDLR